ncbi:hypothetical protein [Corynebacterium otitidis]|uniref:Uncharacterized protein n=1 Tax=Corynebacterium otitidis ATCC 51513 TaxID=883169 RepID=I7KJY8_9CORY|nr:hypothetical protein [Corynebacterium otitidis]EJZ81269.1 hypothetical protein HMPREF9719_01787 [Corynebacterium otitidis ATCC 51513]KKO83815.1 hypothetical protein AAV33_04515 [Corynebacterium otitidis]CCI83965.1 hypothetical protein BN46_1240 [Corynebacterium otitidis ATCC 51513]
MSGPPRGLSLEALLGLADEVCELTGASVRSIAALAAAAATTEARLHGVPLHESATQAAASLAEVIRRTAPLSTTRATALLASLAAEVLTRLNDAPPPAG